MSDNKIQWKFILIGIVIFAAMIGLLYGIYGTIWYGMYNFLFILFLGTLILLPYMIFKSSMPDFVVDKLLFWIPKNKSTWNWFILMILLMFISLNGMFGISIYRFPAESSIILIREFVLFYVISLSTLIFGIIMLLVSKNIADPKLSGILSQKITPELIAENPQAAIETAFTVFEDYLRKKFDDDSDSDGENLINRAFSEQNGLLYYGSLDKEQKNIRNFMSGANAIFRNPRKHRIIEDDEKKVRAILSLVDLLIILIDECRYRTTESKNDNV